MDLASFDWDLARAGGVVAYLMLSASVLLGLILSGGWRGVEWPRWITRGVHQHITLAALLFTGAHGVAVWIDPYLRAGLIDILVPLSIAYRPLWVALGIVAGYLMLALWLSERVRPLVGYRLWRAFHFSAFAAYVLATAHGLASGTDTTTWWAFGMYSLSVSAVVVLLWGRLLVTSGSSVVRGAFGAAAGLMVAGGGAWALMGPLQADWGPHAGSRASLTGTPVAAASPAPSAAAALAFDSGFSGSQQLTADSLVISGGLDRRPGARLEVDLSGRVRGSAFSVSSGRMTLTDGGATYAGDIGSIGNGQLAATVADAGGRRVNITLILGSMSGETVSGTVSARPA